MAIPTGSGTEVLKNHRIQGLTSSYQELINGVANHIYTVISIIFTEVGGAEEILHMHTADAGDSNRSAILTSVILPASSTYVWNDKFVITGTQELLAKTSSSADIDVNITYIDQDWT